MVMGKRLYVGSLPFQTTEAELQEIFAACGKVESAKVIIDKETGRSKGFGFVEMGTDEEAKAAIAKMNGSAVGDRKIVVNEARPMEERKPGGGNFGNRPGGGFRGNRDRGDGGGFGGGGKREGGWGGGDSRRRSGGGGNRKNSDEGHGNRW
jgi:RNA recognition motif-containing protein